MNIIKYLLKPLSYVGLVATILPAFLLFYDWIPMDRYQQFMLWGSLLWIVTAPWWINKRD
ncbi:hypothetical protein [Algivirga pacifica]|uniref:hypothetical protein n=1 Tax=Algivirga pacifica TaxID=1162670 RepID=UPI0031EA97C1